jgi:polysaccharide export outer membrane protein
MNRLILTCLAVLAVATGCQFPGERTFDPRLPPVSLPASQLTAVSMATPADSSLLQPSAQLFTLGPGDRLEIDIMGEPTSDATVNVGPDGKIYYNLLPGIDVWGMTLDQVKQSVEQGLTRFMRETPAVSVTLRGVESKKIWMLGRFENPGVYPLTNSITLLEAIYEAGGPQNQSGARSAVTMGYNEDLADLGHSFVLRDGHILPVDFQRLFRGDLTQNIYLQSDDFVYLPALTADEVHVFGAVVETRAVPFVRQLTLIQALASCGGTIKDAHLRQVAIVRGSLHKPEIALVDYKEILEGKKPDVYLAAGDIVYVPFTPWRVITKYLDLVATTFVSAVAINEGAYATIPSPPATQGILIPFGAGITISATPAAPGATGPGVGTISTP